MATTSTATSANGPSDDGGGGLRRRVSDLPRRVGVWFATTLPVPGWLVLLVLYVAASYATIVTRTQWVSDSRLYLAWTYWYMGHDQHTSFQLTKQLLENMDGVGPGCNFCWKHGYRYDFFDGAYGAVVGPRALYPVLSIPFVALIGGWGMLVVPAVAFAATIVVLVAFVSKRYGPRWALVAGAVLILSTTVSRWSMMAMTEAPAMFFTTAVLLVLPIGRATRRKHLVWFLVLLVLGLFTRQFAVVIPMAVFLTWFVVWVRDRKFVNRWFPFALWSGITGIAALLVQGWLSKLMFSGATYSYKDHFFHNVKYYPGYGRGKLGLPHTALRVLEVLAREDLKYLTHDILTIAVLAVALVGVLWRFRSEVSALAVGMFVGTYLMNFVIVLPTYFRYASTQYAFFLVAAIALAADLWGPHRRRPSRSTEAVPGDRPDRPSDAPPGPGGWPDRRWLGQPLRTWVLLGALWVFVAVVIVGRDRPGASVGLVVGVAAMTAAIVLVTALATVRFGDPAGLVAGVVMVLCPEVVGLGLHGKAAPGVAIALCTALLVLLLQQRGLRRSLRVPLAVGLLVVDLLASWAAVGLPAWHALSAGVVNRVVSKDFRDLVPDRVLFAVLLAALAAAVLALAGRTRCRPLVAFAVGAFGVGLVVALGTGALGFGPFVVAFPLVLLAALVAGRALVAGWPAGPAAPSLDCRD